MRPSSSGVTQMVEQRIPVTKEGYENLKLELKRLKSEERPKSVKAIEEALGHGDLSENAEYEAAKEHQGQLEMRIRELENKLSRAEVLALPSTADGTVVFGSTVVVEDLDSGEKKRFRIVGEPEADLKNNKISITSPVARSLIGKKVGDDVSVEVPAGQRSYEILEVVNE